MWSFWRPAPAAPPGDIAGEKLQMSMFVAAQPEGPCLCGSGKSFGSCCRPLPYWYPLSPNPKLNGYSLWAPQEATFAQVDGPRLRERLCADRRLRCTELGPKRNFWTLWGHPPVRREHGIVCFGDIELKDDRTLVATAVSAARTRALMRLLENVAGDILDAPQLTQDRITVIDKRNGKSRELPPPPAPPIRWGAKRKAQ